MLTTFNAERPLLAGNTYWRGTCFLGSAKPPIPRGQSRVLPNLGVLLYLYAYTLKYTCGGGA